MTCAHCRALSTLRLGRFDAAAHWRARRPALRLSAAAGHKSLRRHVGRRASSMFGADRTSGASTTTSGVLVPPPAIGGHPAVDVIAMQRAFHLCATEERDWPVDEVTSNAPRLADLERAVSGKSPTAPDEALRLRQSSACRRSCSAILRISASRAAAITKPHRPRPLAPGAMVGNHLISHCPPWVNTSAPFKQIRVTDAPRRNQPRAAP